MNVNDIKTNGDAADFVNECDLDDTPIHIALFKAPNDDIFVAVDNYRLFQELTLKDPSEDCELNFSEEDGKYLIN